MKVEDLDILILCGGEGKRVKPILGDLPKAMAKIKDRPFLELLINFLRVQGVKRLILCTGYGAGVIREYFSKKNFSMEILFSEEKIPLGTAGAIKNAELLIRSDPFVVMNGDSFCELDLKDFLGFHSRKKAYGSLALSYVEDLRDYGKVMLREDSCIILFEEKSKETSGGMINAGVYLFSKEMLRIIPKGRRCSLEYELLPALLDKGIYGYVVKGRFVDIGRPESYKQAIRILS